MKRRTFLERLTAGMGLTWIVRGATPVQRADLLHDYRDWRMATFWLHTADGMRALGRKVDIRSEASGEEVVVRTYGPVVFYHATEGPPFTGWSLEVDALPMPMVPLASPVRVPEDGSLTLQFRDGVLLRVT